MARVNTNRKMALTTRKGGGRNTEAQSANNKSTTRELHDARQDVGRVLRVQLYSSLTRFIKVEFLMMEWVRRETCAQHNTCQQKNQTSSKTQRWEPVQNKRWH